MFLGAGIGNVEGGQYRYLQDLLSLEATATGRSLAVFRPATPLALAALERALAGHPDQHFSRYILASIAKGIHIGADRSMELHTNMKNLPSVRQHPVLVEAHIKAEVEAGRMLGPLPPYLASMEQTSPIGLIPKPHQPGKWRLIVDLSSPSPHSVNDAITVDSCHMQYASATDAAKIIRELGVGTQLAKLDLHNAWFQYMQMTLPARNTLGSGCVHGHSPPLRDQISTQDLLSSIERAGMDPAGQGSQVPTPPPNSQACALALQQTLRVCQELGVPVAVHKTEGPRSQLTFLGNQLDTVGMELSLPPAKLARITAVIGEWTV